MNHPSKEQIAYDAGYKITADGSAVFDKNGRRMPFSYTRDGYARFDCRHQNGRFSMRFHRLQAWQKYGHAMHAPGIVCRHIDGNPKNNAACNIVLGTQRENQLDRPLEERRAHAIKASRCIMVYNHHAVVAFYKQHGWAKTMSRFKIASKGSLSFILRKSIVSKTQPCANRGVDAPRTTENL